MESANDTVSSLVLASSPARVPARLVRAPTRGGATDRRAGRRRRLGRGQRRPRTAPRGAAARARRVASDSVP